MKTQTSKTRIWISTLLLLPIIAILFYSFTEREYVEKASQANTELFQKDKILNVEINAEDEILVNGELTNYELLESFLQKLPNPELYTVNFKTNVYTPTNIKTLKLLLSYNLKIPYDKNLNTEELTNEIKKRKFTNINGKEVFVIEGGDWSDIENYIIDSRQQIATAEDVEKYNQVAKRINSTTRDNRIIQIVDLENILLIYERMSNEQKKHSEPFPLLNIQPSEEHKIDLSQRGTKSQQKDTVSIILHPILEIKNDNTLWLNGVATNLETIQHDFNKVVKNKKSVLNLKSSKPVSHQFINEILQAIGDKIITINVGKGYAQVYDGKLSAKEEKSLTKNNTYARSIDLKILNDGSYLIDRIKATKKTFVKVFNQLHQDITPEVRNKIMNIHVSSTKDISNEEVWFIYNSLQDYGFYRIVTPNQEVNRAKGNTPFAIESHFPNHENSTTKQTIKEINIHIDKEENIFLNKKPITTNNLVEKVNALNAHLSVDDKQKFLNATISYENDSESELVREINNRLLNSCNIYRTISLNIEHLNKSKQSNYNSNPYSGKSLEEAKAIYDTETFDFSVKEQKADSPWKYEISDVTFIETDKKPKGTNITEAELQEYNTLVAKINALPSDQKIVKKKDFERMHSLYANLSDAQKARAASLPTLWELPPAPPKPNTIPLQPDAPTSSKSAYEYVRSLKDSEITYYFNDKKVSYEEILKITKENPKISIHTNIENQKGTVKFWNNPSMHDNRIANGLYLNSQLAQPEMNFTKAQLNNLKIELKNEVIKSFSFKMPGKMTESINGSSLNRIATKHIEEATIGDSFQLFNFVNDKGENFKYSVIVKIID